MMKYKVFEDNGGGLHLAALNDNDECIYFGSGYEYNPAGLITDLTALCANEDPASWEGDTNPQGRCNWAMTAVAARNGGMQIIADNDGVYRRLMGGAGAAALTRQAARAIYRRH